MDTPLPMEPRATKMLRECMLQTFDTVVLADGIISQEWLDPMAMAMGKHHISITDTLTSIRPETKLQQSAFYLWTPTSRPYNSGPRRSWQSPALGR